MKTLIVVDVQYDFYSPEGSLYVPGGEKVVPVIEELIKTDPFINQVIFTVDWHTAEDESFRKWPPHCIQYTKGATLPESLIKACISRGFKSVDGKYELERCDFVTRSILIDSFDIFEKGSTSTHEEYGAFENSEDAEDNLIELSNFNEDSFAYIIPGNDVVLCGLAGDYCVLETAKNLLSVPEIGKLSFYLPGIASIDGGEKLTKWIKENGL